MAEQHHLCGNCYESAQEYRILHCTHKLCTFCATQSYLFEKAITCPTCRQKTNAKPETLPLNSSTYRYNFFYHPIVLKQVKKCDEETCSAEATTFCFACNAHFCASCFKQAHATSITKKHQSLALQHVMYCN